MNTICPNCQHEITGNFCSNCGQKKYKRIDRKYISDELQYSLLHTNKGFFYSVKSIAKNPGKTAREFIDGNRVNHYKPILLVLLLSGISAFVSFKLVGLEKTMILAYANMGIKGSIAHSVISAISTYNSFIMLLFVPIFAGLTKLAFWKSGHNYFEHIVFNAFIVSFYTIATIVISSPILYFIKDDPQLTMLISMIFMSVFTPVMLVWFFKGLYPEKKLLTIILRVLLIGVLLFCLYILAIIIMAVALIVFQPEMVMKMKNK